MKRSESMESAPLDVRIEAYLDGELDATEAARLEAAFAADPALLDELEMARAVRETLRGMPAAAAPPDLVPGILAVARSEARSEWFGRLRDGLRKALLADWRPALAMASLVLIVWVAVRVDRDDRQVVAADPQVTEALEQVKWTLAVVADVGRRTGRTVRNDVLEAHVVGPVQEALSHVFEPSQHTQ